MNTDGFNDDHLLLNRSAVDSFQSIILLLPVRVRVCVCASPVCDEHREFKDMKLFYRFRKDDGTFPLDSEAKVFMRGQRIYEK